MEPITHFLFGGVMARAGLNRTSALATTTLVLAAEAPDLDVLARFGGRIAGFQHHRGFTHTLLGIPCMAAFIVLVLYTGYYSFGRRRAQPGKAAPRWCVLFGLACLAGISHILLDFTNNYGVRPFEPFSYRWYSWDIVFIVEPVLWVILAGALVLPPLFRLVTEEVSSRRTGSPPGRGLAVIALILVFFFWGVRDYQHRRALAALQALTYEGDAPLRVSAYPYYVNVFRWYGVVETSRFYDSLVVNSRSGEVDPENRALIRYKPEQTAVELAAKQAHLGRIFLDWAQYPITETEPLETPAGYLVRFLDVRFLYPGFSGSRTLGGWVRLNDALQATGQGFGIYKEAAD